MADEPKKRTYKSGSQKRKERAARAATAPAKQGTPVRYDRSMSIGGNQWSSQYATASAQWDPNGPPVELPIYGVAPPTVVAAVQSAVLQLEQGAFWSAAYLWDGMLRDDRLSATLAMRIDRLVGAPMEIEAIDPDNEKAQTVADDLKKQISRIMPSHQLYELMRYALGLSVGIAQVTSTRTATKTTPTFQVWNPRNLRFDWLLRRYCLVTENRGEIVLEPDDPEWIIYEPFGPHGWMHGAMIRAAAQPWLIRYWTRTWWARHQEVHGQPMRLGIIPAERDPADERLFLSQLSNLAHEAVVRLPQGTEGNKFDLKLLEATANTWQGFHQLLQHCDDSFAILFLGQRQSTAGQGGLSAQENAGEDSMEHITRKDALVMEVIRDQLLKPWAKSNYGDEELAPYLCPQIEPPEDESKAADVDQKIGAALMAFKTAGAPIDIREFLEQRGYPLLTEAEEKKQKADAMEEAQQMAAVMAPANEPDGDEPTGKTEDQPPASP